MLRLLAEPFSSPFLDCAIMIELTPSACIVRLRGDVTVDLDGANAAELTLRPRYGDAS